MECKTNKFSKMKTNIIPLIGFYLDLLDRIEFCFTSKLIRKSLTPFFEEKMCLIFKVVRILKIKLEIIVNEDLRNILEKNGNLISKEIKPLLYDLSLRHHKTIPFLIKSFISKNKKSHINVVDLDGVYFKRKGAKYLSYYLNQNQFSKELNLSNNSISQETLLYLDNSISCMISLKVLILSNNKLTDEKSLELVISIINKTPFLEKLFLDNNKFDCKGISFKYGINKNNCLTYLNISNCNLNDSCIQYLIESLIINHQSSKLTIRKLILSNNNISCYGALCVAELIELNTIIEEIDLSENFIWENGLKHILAALTKNNNLSEIGLNGNLINEKGMMRICKHLPSFKNLKSFSIQGNKYITPETLECVLNTVKSNKNITYLNLSSIKMDSTGIKLISIFISEIKDKIELNLSNNYLAFNEIDLLLMNLKNSNNVVSINLSKNFLNMVSSLLLTQIFENNSLIDLDLSNNNLNSIHNIEFFFKGLEENKSLRRINLSNNLLSNKVRYLFRSFSYHSNIMEIIIEDNNIGDIHLFEEFSLFFENNKSFERINLKNNKINDFDLISILESFKLNTNSRLIFLNLKDNLILNSITNLAEEMRLEKLKIKVQIGNFLIENAYKFNIEIKESFRYLNSLGYIL